MSRLVLQYLAIVGVAVHLGLLAVWFLLPDSVRGWPAWAVLGHAEQKLARERPRLAESAEPLISLARLLIPRPPDLARSPIPKNRWLQHGARPGREFEIQTYRSASHPDPARTGSFEREAFAKIIEVEDEQALLNGLKRATPGTLIELLPGEYRIKSWRVRLGNDGSAEAPIYLRGTQYGRSIIELDAYEGFYVDRSFWVFENLVVRGTCEDHSRCEHAFHVVGDARSTTIRNSELVDFNAPLKVNGRPIDGVYTFPDYGLLEYVTVHNRSPRRTDNPVTLLNINSANHWRVRRSIIADFSKGRGNRISYGAFMKGNSRFGVFEQNLVVCEWDLGADEGIRIGLSLGGGGTGSQYCRNDTCLTEHTAGTIRNNIIANCSRDVGIYLNRAAASLVYNNLLYRTLGIDARYPTTTAKIFNNITDGGLRRRDGGDLREYNNLRSTSCIAGPSECEMQDWYAAPQSADFRLRDGGAIRAQPSAPQAGLVDDFCGASRPRDSDIGPIDYAQALERCLPSAE
jgi:hypothetical protein